MTARQPDDDDDRNSNEINHSRLRRALDRDDSERWSYETERNSARIRSSLLAGEIDALDDIATGEIRTLPTNGHGVPVGVEIAADGDTVGTLVHLSPDQAEALAADLLEQARAARD